MVLALLVILFVFLGIQDSRQPKGYWHYVEGYYPRLSGGYGGAPDGEYTILISFINETDRVVGSAYSQSSPGHLHGYWHYTDDVFLNKGMFEVWLKDNVIILAKELEW